MTKITVRLEPFERKIGEELGKYRNKEAINSGKKDRYGFTGDPVRVHTQGALGELAVCKGFNLYFTPTVNTFKSKPDLLDHLEIRTRTRHDYDLLVRPDDDPNKIYILITGEAPEYIIHGWLPGTSAKQKQWLQTYGDRPPAFFIPKEALLDPSLLVTQLHKGLSNG